MKGCFEHVMFDPFMHNDLFMLNDHDDASRGFNLPREFQSFVEKFGYDYLDSVTMIPIKIIKSMTRCASVSNIGSHIYCFSVLFSEIQLWEHEIQCFFSETPPAHLLEILGKDFHKFDISCKYLCDNFLKQNIPEKYVDDVLNLNINRYLHIIRTLVLHRDDMDDHQMKQLLYFIKAAIHTQKLETQMENGKWMDIEYDLKQNYLSEAAEWVEDYKKAKESFYGSARMVDGLTDEMQNTKRQRDDIQPLVFGKDITWTDWDLDNHRHFPTHFREQVFEIICMCQIDANQTKLEDQTWGKLAWGNIIYDNLKADPIEKILEFLAKSYENKNEK